MLRPEIAFQLNIPCVRSLQPVTVCVYANVITILVPPKKRLDSGSTLAIVKSQRYTGGMAKEPVRGAQLLSVYPAAKVIVECDKCGMRAKYDKLEMLEAGGDRPLTDLLEDIARRKG